MLHVSEELGVSRSGFGPIWCHPDREQPSWLMAAVVIQLLIGVVCRESEMLASAHALGALLVGLWAAFHGHRELGAIALIYIVAFEVVWRMAEARVNWEFGKYAVVLIVCVSILRGHTSVIRLPMVYLLLLLPGIVPTLATPLPMPLRKVISYNISGPLSLSLAICYFSEMKISKSAMRRLLCTACVCTCSLSVILYLHLKENPVVTFNTESNYTTSGGFGPNQVSPTLALGTVCAFLAIPLSTARSTRLILVVLAAVFGAQSALTFSRAGIWLVAISLAPAGLLLLRSRRVRMQALSGLLLLVLAGIGIFPYLNDYTNGALSRRFADTGTTHRAELVVDEMQTWSEHPMWGCGVGVSRFLRRHPAIQSLPTHTEFSRMLAEHGVPGLLALGVLVWLGVQRVLRQSTPLQQALSVALMCWSVGYMCSAAMRLAVPNVVFAVAFVSVTGVASASGGSEITEPVPCRS